MLLRILKYSINYGGGGSPGRWVTSAHTFHARVRARENPLLWSATSHAHGARFVVFLHASEDIKLSKLKFRGKRIYVTPKQCYKHHDYMFRDTCSNVSRGVKPLQTTQTFKTSEDGCHNFLQHAKHTLNSFCFEFTEIKCIRLRTVSICTLFKKNICMFIVLWRVYDR